MDYVRNQKPAGVMAWNLGQDLPDGGLLNAVVSGLKP
jgi:GH18 family chitinase